jgi:hypothetical protein
LRLGLAGAVDATHTARMLRRLLPLAAILALLLVAAAPAGAAHLFVLTTIGTGPGYTGAQAAPLAGFNEVEAQLAPA